MRPSDGRGEAQVGTAPHRPAPRTPAARDMLTPPAGLFVAGMAPEDGGTVVLLAPDGARFWQILQAAPEGRDGRPDPVDRWSLRVIAALARDSGGRAVFPFGGPPYAPFMRWALASGRAWVSPVGMLVHDAMGLWTSFRGAVWLPRPCPPAPTAAAPCLSCASQPCRSACPVDALKGDRYDTDACHGWLDRAEGRDCLTLGCAARRACPVAAAHGRLPAQTAHHMTYFHPPKTDHAP